MNVLNKEFQTDLIKVIIQDHSFLPTHRSLIDKNLFSDEIESIVIEQVLKYFDKYSTVPSYNSLFTYMSIDRFEGEDIETTVKPYYEDTVKDITFIEESITEFVKKKRLKEVIKNCTNLLDQGEYEQIYTNVKKIVYDDLGGDIGNFFWKNKQNILISLDNQEEYLSTGIHKLDSNMSGGILRGTLNVILTPPNKGKSTFLVNFGKYAALNGLKVIHYTFELSTKVIERRYFQSMVRMSKHELKTRKRTAYSKLLEFAQGIMNESILIKHFPANSCTCGDIKRHLNLVKNKLGYIPDVIIFDYADLIQASSKYEQKRFEVEATYYELRNIAIEYNSGVWTASQTNRTGAKEKLIGMEDLDECYKKAAAADIILSVNQSMDEMRGTPQTARIFFAKNRDDKSNITEEIRTDWAKAWVGNL